MTRENLDLLRQLCNIHAPSGDEFNMKQFILHYVEKHASSWTVQPEVVAGPSFQDNVILRFGVPRVAAIAHMDSVGFTVRYGNQLVPIGSPSVQDGDMVAGMDGLGPIECSIYLDNKHHAYHRFGRGIERGTTLVWKPAFEVQEGSISATFLDNRIGVYTLLRIAEGIKHGLLVFSTWEEHGGGSVPYLTKYFYETHRIDKCLIADVTWVSDGIVPGGGVVISMRDAYIPRRAFTGEILTLAESQGGRYQIEVEAGGSSDGREVHQSPYPVDWCFIGPCLEDMHSSRERVAMADLEDTVAFYRALFGKL